MSGTVRASSAGRHRRSARWLLVAAVLIATLAPIIPTFLRPLPVEAATRMIKLPVTSGTSWTVTQGYNTNPNQGGSHYNCLEFPERSCSQYWTYKYSFDLVKVGGDTAGEPVLSPVTGTIRWIDHAYGGMSIDLGNAGQLRTFTRL